MHFLFNRKPSIAEVLSTKFPIPAKVLTELLSNDNSDVFLQQVSGSGKTTSMVACSLNLINPKRAHVQCLIFCSTSDGALQVYEVMSELVQARKLRINVSLTGKHKGHDHGHVLNDSCTRSKMFHAKDPYNVLIGTPNELLDDVEKNSFLLSHVNNIFFDDADAYISWDKIQKFLGKLNASTRVFYLTTTTNLSLDASLAQNKMQRADHGLKQLVLNKTHRFNKAIHQIFVPFRLEDQLIQNRLTQTICKLFFESNDHGQVIIFCTNRATAEELGEWLNAGQSK